jgi:hypothetical protein
MTSVPLWCTHTLQSGPGGKGVDQISFPTCPGMADGHQSIDQSATGGILIPVEEQVNANHVSSVAEPRPISSGHEHMHLYSPRIVSTAHVYVTVPSDCRKSMVQRTTKDFSFTRFLVKLLPSHRPSPKPTWKSVLETALFFVLSCALSSPYPYTSFPP